MTKKNECLASNTCIIRVDDHESGRKYDELEGIDDIVFGYSTVFYITGIVPKTLAQMKKRDIRAGCFKIRSLLYCHSLFSN